MDQNVLDEIGRRVGSAARKFTPGYGPTPVQKQDAAAVLAAMVEGVAEHGVTFAHFDSVADFPRMAIQLVQRRDARI